MKNKIKDLYKDISEINTIPIRMFEANQPIQIFEGDFQLNQDDNSIKINGIIQFNWFPSTGARFSGKITDCPSDIIQLTKTNKKFELIIDGLKFGDSYITNTSLSNDISLEGIMVSDVIKGDKSIPVTKINFTIPNLRDFFGIPVKRFNEEGGIQLSRSRIRFENNKFVITIDKCHDFKDLHKSLTSKGGYIILYYGELTKKRGHIKFDELKDTIHCFSTFLSFLNGRRCSPHFLHGFYKDKVTWIDFTNYKVDQYKSVFSWPQKHSINGLNDLWKTFSKLWKDDNDKDFLISAIHWYVEANINSGFTEGSIIMAQTALELIYNWLIIEKKKLLIGKDSKNISASNKIRLLLSQLKLSNEIPKPFTNLQSLVDTNNEIVDGPDIFVQIRNAIIHSQEENRKKLTKMHYRVKYEARQLGLWYIELSLLNILKFQGKYFNRCSGALWAGEGEVDVPWIKENSF